MACVYAYFKRFVEYFIPNNLHSRFNGRETVLAHVKCCVTLTDMVLQYVDKELHSHLETHNVVAEIYATDWVMTLFSRIADLHIVYEIWEIFLFERDKFFVFYFAVALLRLHRTQLFMRKSMNLILQTISSL